MDCWMYIEPCRIEISGFGVKTQISASQTWRISPLAKYFANNEIAQKTQLAISEMDLPFPTWNGVLAFLEARGAIRGLFSQCLSTVKPPNII